MPRQVDFFDGAESSTVPTIGNIDATSLVQYANDAAYEAANLGSPLRGNIYANSTSNTIRWYNGTAWTTLVDADGNIVLTNKTIDGTDLTGTNTVLNDSHDVSYDNTVSGLTATNVKQAVDELDGRLDTAESDINTLQSDLDIAEQDIDDLETLSGSPGATHHGTFTGTTIPDNSTTKAALQALETEVETKLDSAEKGQPNGVAELDGTGKVPAAQLPSFVDDVLEYADLASFPVTGETGKIYVALDTNLTYRWSGSVYIEISPGTVSADSINGTHIRLNNDEWLRARNAANDGDINIIKVNNLDAIRIGNSANINIASGQTTQISLAADGGGISSAPNPDGTFTFDFSEIDFGGGDGINPMTVGFWDGDYSFRARIKAPTSLAAEYTLTLPPDNGQPGQKLTTDGSGITSWEDADSGISGIITGNNSTADNDVGDWLAYQDTAQNTPVDANGGTPNITITRTTTGGEVLNGLGSFKIAKGAANRQGEGVSLLLDVPKYLRGQPSKFKFSYDASANFSYGSASDPVGTPSDISGFLYDVTNSKLLTPNQPGIFGGGYYESLVQIPSNCTQVRAVLHIATTNANAWDFFFDNVELELSYNDFIKNSSDWATANTITIGSTGTPPTKGTTAYDRYRWKQDGADWLLEYDFRNTGTGSAGTGDYLISLPTGVLVDTDKVLVYSGAGATDDDNLDMQQAIIGFGAIANATDRSHVHVMAYSETQFRMICQVSGLNGNWFGASGYNLGSAQSFKLLLRFPGKGLSSGITHPAQIGLNAQASMRAFKNGGSITADTVIPSWTTVEKDSTGSFNATTGIYTVKSPGDYYVWANTQQTVASTNGIDIYLNGVKKASGGTDANSVIKMASTTLVNLKYGDTIDIRGTLSRTLASLDTATYLCIFKIDSSSQPYAPRIAYLKDIKSANTAGGTFTSGAWQTRELNTLSGDQGFVSLSTNQFTLQPGTYHIKAITPAYSVTMHKCKLRNITDSTDAIIGSSAFTDLVGSDDVQTDSVLEDTITISSAKVFEVQHQCASTQTTDGFGVASNFGVSEVYTTVKVTKVL